MCPKTRIPTLKKKSEFQNLFSDYKTYRCRYFKTIYRRNKDKNTSFAISISRKTEPLAIKRNKGKRRLRAAMHKTCAEDLPAIDMLLIPTKEMLSRKTRYKDIERSLNGFFRKINT